MRRKFKNAIRDSFSFPETANKDDFFRQVEGNSVREKKHRRYMPMMLGFAAGAAAMALCIGVWENMKNSPIPSEYNYSVGDSIIVTSIPDESETVTTEQYGTETTIATDFSSVITQTTTSAVTDKGEISAEVTESTSSVLTQGTSAVTVTKPIVTTTSVAYVSTAPVTTITTTTSTDENDERSIYMKKLTAFTSAITILAASGSLNAYAEYQPPEITADVQAVIDYIDSTNPDLDFNIDGVFDARDIYSFYKYTTSQKSDEITAKCAQNGDINKDGIIDFDDYLSLEKYATEIGDVANTELDFNCDGNYFTFDLFTLYDYIYITTLYTEDETGKILANGDVNGDGEVTITDVDYLREYYVLKGSVKPDELMESHYEIEGIPGINSEQSMVYALKRDITAYDMGYRIITDKVKNGQMSLDFNHDEKTNIIDAYDYYRYFSEKKYYASYEEYYANDNTGISQELWNSCEYFDSIRPDGTGSEGAEVRSADYAVIKYFLYNNEITEDILSVDMYEKHNSDHALAFVNELNLMASNEGIAVSDENVINDELFWQYYDACEAEFNNGTRPLPDADLNGVIDYDDYFVSNIFFGDRLENVSCEDSILPADIWNNLNENCDFSGNGISGDVYDTSIIQIYVLKHAEEEPEDFDEAYQEYIKEFAEAKDSAISASVYSDNLMYSTQCKMLSDREQTQSDTDPSLYGDADLDGKVTMADVVKVTLYASNPEKNPLTEEALNNCDVYQRGDGVGISDALSIQKKIAQVIDTLPEV